MNKSCQHARLPAATRLLALASLLCGSAQAASPSLSLAPADGSGQRQMVVEGSWSPRCLPAPANSWSDGQDVYLELRSPARSCGSEAKSAFELRGSPVELQPAAADRGRPWRLHLLDAESGTLLAFALEGGEPAQGGQPESGLWWPEAGGEFDNSGPGLGIQVEIQGTTLALNLSGYADDGRPTWWFGAGPLASPAQVIELSALNGGAGPFGDYAAPKQVDSAGTLHIEWRGTARAVFWFTRPARDGKGLELRPVSMTRFAFATRPGESWVGDWLLQRQQGEQEARIELHRFEWLTGDAESFELLSDRGLRLVCRRATASLEQAPQACRAVALGGGKAVRFASVGLDGMQTLQDGERIQLRRLR